jgi:hypothetical protein
MAGTGKDWGRQKRTNPEPKKPVTKGSEQTVMQGHETNLPNLDGFGQTRHSNDGHKPQVKGK